MFKPELLLPAGTLDSFFAALDGGADAVYAGVKRFNARNRAKNFSYDEISNMVREAHRQNAKVYITLNTLIKNEEILSLIETLHFVSQCKVDAIIIQDYAILNIAKKFFPNLEIHSSTQMGIHNSEGCNFLAENNIRRAILSRELNLNELNKVSEKSPIPIEIFVHGALCYSFSGQCLFSSYLGGFSANRGMCAQVCRRKFESEGKVENIFSLKDLQLIDYVPTFSQYGVKSLKIEGRMKSPEYVYNTSRAYRSVIDDHSKVEDAKEILEFDFAREKTSWFIGKSLGDAITKNTGTGIFIGKIKQELEKGFMLDSEIEISPNSKLRHRSAKDTETSFLKIETLQKENLTYTVTCNAENLTVGDEIYLVGSVKTNLRTKFSAYQKQNLKEIAFKQKDAIKNSFKINRVQNSMNKLYVRISDLQALSKINLNNYDGVFLKLKFTDFVALEKVNFN